MPKKIKICDFVKSELKYFESECNFTADELKVFRCLSRAMSRRDIASEMELSQKKISAVSKTVRQKIKRAQELKGDGDT